jgi:hypothetical protein
MESTPRLSHTLVYVFSQHQSWVELRHLKTLAWMIVGLIPSGKISLTAWTPYVHSRAVYAQRIVRRFARWLEHDRIDVHALSGPLMPHALAAWGSHSLSLALETSILWNTYCVVRMSLVYRGRAVPLVWKVLEHPSRRVAYDIYQDVLDRVAELLPCRCPVVLTAERGVADTHLMEHLARLGWHWCIRIKGSFWIDRDGKRGGKVKRMPLSPGKALFWHWVYITKPRYGPVHIAMARCHEGKE